MCEVLQGQIEMFYANGPGFLVYRSLLGWMTMLWMMTVTV